MITQLLIKKFVKNNQDVRNEKVRNAYGLLAGSIGIFSNILLFGIKIFIGLVTNSIAVVADAFNNLSDVASSIITIFGFKLSSKPADAEHPYGHGRIEYITALLVSMLVILLGYEFIKASYNRIRHSEEVHFAILPLILIMISIIIKIWLSRFNKCLGKKIDSGTLKASSLDAFADVIISGCVFISLLFSLWTPLPVDGYLGLLVSAFILYSGLSMVKDTLNPILGEAPEPKVVETLKNKLLSFEHISGIHDLIVHNYGPGRCMASVHAEVPYDMPLAKIHEAVDKAEKEISEELGIFMVIHMDPITRNSEEINVAREEIKNILEKFPSIKSFHDFRVVGDGEFKNLVFDIEILTHKKVPHMDEKNMLKAIDLELKKIHPNYTALITVDRHFNLL